MEFKEEETRKACPGVVTPAPGLAVLFDTSFVSEIFRKFFKTDRINTQYGKIK